MLADIVDSVVCPHNRAIDYYIEALAYPNCTFWGRKTGFIKSAVRYVTYSVSPANCYCHLNRSYKSFNSYVKKFDAP